MDDREDEVGCDGSGETRGQVCCGNVAENGHCLFECYEIETVKCPGCDKCRPPVLTSAFLIAQGKTDQAVKAINLKGNGRFYPPNPRNPNLTRPMELNDFPRRRRLELLTPTERSLVAIGHEIEALGAHPRLTDAVVHLQAVRDAVADFVEAQTAENVKAIEAAALAAKAAQPAEPAG